jgi:hypothetical protein
LAAGGLARLADAALAMDDMRRPPTGRPSYELLDPLICGQGWVLDGAELDPVDGDDDADGVDDSEVVVASCVDVLVDVAEPLVAASATPVTPALRPAAITAVMISRRVRAVVLETIGLLLSRRAASSSSHCEQAARSAWLGTER